MQKELQTFVTNNVFLAKKQQQQYNNNKTKQTKNAKG